MKRCALFILLGVTLGGWFVAVESALAQGTAFTYQGRLAGTNGQTLTGNFDMQFKLHPAATTIAAAIPYQLQRGIGDQSRETALKPQTGVSSS